MAEPQKECEERLKLNRRCEIDTRAVYSESGKTLDFFSTRLPGLSTLAPYHNSNGKNSEHRFISNSYKVNTVSLNELLEGYAAPLEIDYISIDTEGSELEILSTFEFSKYKVKIWTIEHNFSAHREKVFSLMKKKGYRRVFSDLSQVDDWFVSDEIALRIE